MNKTVTIHLQSVPVIMEEAGYTLFKQYLHDIEQQLAATPDHQEIINDIELSIVEKWEQTLHSTQPVITLAQVQIVISQLGQVQDFAVTDNSMPTPQNSDEKIIHKQIYRDSDHAIIAGVAAGLANAFGIPVMIVRAIFIALALFFGSGVILYIVLWLVIPVADTPSKKAMMLGKAITITTLQTLQQVESASSHFWSKLRRTILRFSLASLRIIRPCLGVIFVVVGIVGLLTLLFAVVAYALNQDTIQALVPINGILSVVEQNFTIGLIIVLVGLPLADLSLLGMSIMRNKSVVSSTVSMIIIVTWGITLAVSAAMGTYIVNRVQQQHNTVNPIMTKTDYPINPFTTLTTRGEYKVELVQGDTYSVSVTGRTKKIAQLDIKQDNDVLNIATIHTNRDEQYIWCPWCGTESATITVTLPDIAQIITHDSGFITANHLTFDQLNIEMHDESMIFFDDTVGKQLKTELHDQTHLSIAGAADALVLSSNGESDFTGVNFKAQDVQVNMSEQSSAAVNVVGTISGTMLHTSYFMYLGSPTITVEKGKSSTIISEVEADQIPQQGGYVIKDENGQILEQGYMDENGQIIRQEGF